MWVLCRSYANQRELSNLLNLQKATTKVLSESPYRPAHSSHLYQPIREEILLQNMMREDRPNYASHSNGFVDHKTYQCQIRPSSLAFCQCMLRRNWNTSQQTFLICLPRSDLSFPQNSDQDLTNRPILNSHLRIELDNAPSMDLFGSIRMIFASETWTEYWSKKWSFHQYSPKNVLSFSSDAIYRRRPRSGSSQFRVFWYHSSAGILIFGHWKSPRLWVCSK